MIVKTEAVVLKSIKYGDTSRIAVLLTRDYGRVAVIAKGARTKHSRLGPVLDLMNHLQVVFYRKEQRELHLLSQCELVRRFPSLTTDLNRLAHCMSVLELASTVSRSGEDGAMLFAGVLDALEAMDSAEVDAETVLLFFLTRLLALLGIQPDLSACSDCGIALDGRSGTKSGTLRLTEGGVMCGRCGEAGSGSVVRFGTIESVRHIQMMSAAREGEGILPDQSTRKEAREVLRYFLKGQVDGVDRLRSEKVFAGLV